MSRSRVPQCPRALSRAFSHFSLVLAVACARPQAVLDASVADRAAIDAGHEAFVAGIKANDCNALLALLTADVVFVPPNTPQANGPVGVRSWCESTFARVKTKAVVVSNRDVTVTGDWGIEHGVFDWTVVPTAGDDPDNAVCFHCSNLPRDFFESHTMDDQAIIAGTVSREHTNGTNIGSGDIRYEWRFVAIWRRQTDASWKLARDIWNSAPALPVSAASR